MLGRTQFGSALSEEQLAKIAELQKRRDEGETEKLSWWQVRYSVDNKVICYVG